MSGISGLGSLGASNPFSGLGSASAASAGNPLSGLADISSGLGQDTTSGGGDLSGLTPVQPASQSQGASFGDTLKSMIVDEPSAAKAHASDLTSRFLAGENIDPSTLAVENAKAGIDIQMSTRTISSAVSAVRTLFQMQI